MIHIHNSSSSYIANNDYFFYASKVNEQRFNGKRPILLSDWDSGPEVFHLYGIADKAYKAAYCHIDDYYSCDSNFCQVAIREYISRQWSINIPQDQLIIGNNATSLMSFYTQCLLILGIHNFLAVSPLYFTLDDVIKMNGGNITIYQPTMPHFDIDIVQLQRLIIEDHIQAIIITQPLFGFGHRITDSELKKIITVANEYQCTIICDFVREGLIWENDDETTIFGDQLSLLNTCNKYALIYSPCKKLFANGIKTGIMIISPEIKQHILYNADSVIGSISAAQLFFLNYVLDSNNDKIIANQIQKNKKLIRLNYSRIRSLVLDEANIDFIKPDEGNYMVCGLPKKHSDDTMMFLELLHKCEIATLPLSLYNYYCSSKYLFRVNLLLNSCNLMRAYSRILEYEF